MLALHIMGQAMGDLNHREEYQLDSFLDKFFTNRIPEDFLGAKRIIIDEKRKAKKYYRTIIKAGFISLGIASGVMGLIGLIEGIIYLTKSDEEFQQMYVYNHKGWF